MSVAHLLTQPAAMVCMSRVPPKQGETSWFKEEIVLRISGALDAEPLLVLPTSSTTTVGEVKQALFHVRGIPVVEQRLLLGSRRLCADIAAAKYGDDGTPNGNLWIRGNHRLLGEVLGPECHKLGDFVDVVLVRVTPEWAELLEDLREGLVSLSTLDDAVRNDKELVLAAVSWKGGALVHASEGLRADRKVVLTAVQCDPLALQFATDELQDDHEVAFTAVQTCGQALQYASQAQRADREVVLAAVTNSWRSLAFASTELRRDREFMLTAVKTHGSTLLYASQELKDDHEIVLNAVKTSGWALSCASDRMKCDRECVEAAVTSNPAALDFATEALQTDPDLTNLASWASGRRSSSAPCGVNALPPCALL